MTTTCPSPSRQPPDRQRLPVDLERRYGARNYDPLPVVLARGEGVWLLDDEGRRYLDMMSRLFGGQLRPRPSRARRAR